MKLKCSCGAKYAFEATPEMLKQPVKFICPSCGLDASAFVNELIRQEFGGQEPPPPPLPPPVPAAAEPREATPICVRHREPATEKCAVCQKPICPKCLELFGYFCSPLCKGKAEAQKLNVPVYARRGDLVEAKMWRNTGLIATVMGVLAVLFVGVWIWFAWWGSVPHPYFSVRFADDDRGYYGQAQLVGRDQMVFLHGGTLARYDLNTKKPVWTQELIRPEEIAAVVKVENAIEEKRNEGFGMHNHRSGGEIERSARQWLQSQLSLHVAGQNIWVGQANAVTRYDWDSGKVAKEVALPAGGGEFVASGDELAVVGGRSVTRVNLASGDSQVEPLGVSGAVPAAVAQNEAGGGLPGMADNNGQAMDPGNVEAQAQNLNLQGRIALPALLSNARYEQQLEAALQDDSDHPRAKQSPTLAADGKLMQLVPGPTGFAQFTWRMLEQHVATRSAMQAPGKSVLNGDLNATKTTEVANEVLNDMQRNNGGDTVSEDQSRYQVTVHLPDAGVADWTGEVVGPPQLFVLKTVNVIAGGRSVVVLDKTNQKLWSASLTYPLPSEVPQGVSAFGEGPCVERGDTLYVFDQAVLTAFDVTSGNARWRLPSVGVVGLFFDDRDNVYVNTTTGNPDDIKYSRQIDIARKTEAVVSKIEAKTGKSLWTVKPGGFVSYVSGKFIYVVECYDPNPRDHDVLDQTMADLQRPPYLRIARLRPADGSVMWDYYDRDRCPVSWSFDGSSIQLIFKREVQVLRYLTF
jgi:outer membrane protein assembly factor BamB